MDQNTKIDYDWVPFTQVKYRLESVAKQQAVRMGLLLNKTLVVKKNLNDESFSLYQINEIKLKKINRTLEGFS